MNKFELLRSITDVRYFSRFVYALFNGKTRKEIEDLLSEELTEEGLQTVRSIAQSGDYPLSFDGKQ